MTTYPHGDSGHFIPYSVRPRTEDEMLERAGTFHRLMAERRSVRTFSREPVPRRLVEEAIATAGTAPSGAHQQPWTFIVIGDPSLKRQIRIAAEAEERVNYEGGRMPDDWKEAIARLGTSWQKPYLEDAPWLVVLFEQRFGLDAAGNKRKHYYSRESVGIAAGMFITAVHYMGLATLTHTPSPMAFLSRLLGRPANERPFVLFPVGFPTEDAAVPRLVRKSLDEISIFT